MTWIMRMRKNGTPGTSTASPGTGGLLLDWLNTVPSTPVQYVVLVLEQVGVKTKI